MTAFKVLIISGYFFKKLKTLSGSQRTALRKQKNSATRTAAELIQLTDTKNILQRQCLGRNEKIDLRWPTHYALCQFEYNANRFEERSKWIYPKEYPFHWNGRYF